MTPIPPHSGERADLIRRLRDHYEREILDWDLLTEAADSLAAAEADALRYRFLRARMIPEELTDADMAIQCQHAMGPIIGRNPDIDPYIDCDFDAAIDAAIDALDSEESK